MLGPGSGSADFAPAAPTMNFTEDFVASMGGGSGTLEYQGRTYPFKVIGTVAGPGGGVDKITTSGAVYQLANAADFAGRYTEPRQGRDLHPNGSVIDNAGGRYVRLHVSPEAISGSDTLRVAVVKSSKDCNR